MAEYRNCYKELEAAGVELAAISVDDAARSAPMKTELKLPFPVLCDSNRELIAQWGLLNRGERGGIAYPAVFAIDRDLMVRFRSRDRTARRASAFEVAAAARAAIDGAAAEPKLAQRMLRPGVMFFHAMLNGLRRGTRVPWSGRDSA